MTDEQALLKAQSIWGPNVLIKHEVTYGAFRLESFSVLNFDAMGTCEHVANFYCYADLNMPPASWEAMFASVQEVAK